MSRSSTEAEYQALAYGFTEVIWIKELLKNLKIKTECQTRIFCDNLSAISLAHNQVQHDWMKHVNIDRHWIRETLEDYKISTPYIGSSEQLADVLTKGLPKDQFTKLISWMGLMDIHSSA